MMIVALWTIIPGLKLPVPRIAAPIATSGNCSASDGMNQREVLAGERRGLRVGAERSSHTAFGAPAAIAKNSRPSVADEPERLIEDQARVSWSLRPTACDTSVVVPTPSICVAAKHDEHQVAADGDGGDSVGAETSDPVQIDQHVERLKDHRDRA